jgi:hypothetical protein
MCLYKIRKLTAYDEQQRLDFTPCTEHEGAILQNVWILDEAHFNMDGVVSKHNVHFWSAENPHLLIRKVHYADKFIMWAHIK